MLRILQRSLLHRPIYQFRCISSIPTPTSTPPFPSPSPSRTASASSPSSSPTSPPPPAAPPRVRFAPSPTGDLHLGGLRTAAFNWLLARQHPLGKFILRIEDTDQTRYVPGAIEQIQRVLKWAGLDYDEGPDRPGPYGPYIQSQRLPLYKQYAMQLVAQGHAYPCTCTSERLEAMRASHIARHINWMYDRHCAHYTVEEQMSRMEKAQRDGTPFVIRMKVPSGYTTVHDAVRPTQIVDNQSIDDQVLLKSDGFPTYHLAVVVDDHLMRITHALRGEEWRSSTPKHIILYHMLGWEKPIYVHLPLIFNADGSKLSKRDGAASAESYIREGYHPDAVINALALPGLIKTDDKYIYTRKQLIEQFSISAIGTSGGQFDVKKLRHINAEHKRMLLQTDATSFHQTIRNALTTTYPHLTITDDQITTLLFDVLKERVVTAKEFVEQTRWYFQAPDFTTEKAQKARSIVFKNETDTKSLLSLIHTSLSSLPEWSNFDPWFHTFLKQHGLKLPQLGQPMRFVLTGDIHGPSVASLLHALGRDESLARISAHL